MDKATYQRLRRLLRANGIAALKWMTPDEAEFFGNLWASRSIGDYLKERATFRKATPEAILLTTPLHLLKRYQYAKGGLC